MPLDRLELAPNERRDIGSDGIERLAGMLMRAGQLVPCIGGRPDPTAPRTVISAGQRRYLAAQASQRLAGGDGYEGLAPVRSLIVLADMHEIAPELTRGVAKRITTTELHDRALRDLGAFVHRTVVEDEHTYAVRIDDGALLDGPDQLERARAHLTPAGRRQAAGLLGCTPEDLDRELDTLAARARTKALKVRIDGALRDRARTGRYAYVHDRGPDFATGRRTAFLLLATPG